jgi:hypothetical protein
VILTGDDKLLAYLQELGVQDSVGLLESLDTDPILLGDVNQGIAFLHLVDDRGRGR